MFRFDYRRAPVSIRFARPLGDASWATESRQTSTFNLKNLQRDFCLKDTPAPKKVSWAVVVKEVFIVTSQIYHLSRDKAGSIT